MSKQRFSALLHNGLRRLKHKRMQTERLSRKTLAFFFLLAGAALVALVALAFAFMADFAAKTHAQWVRAHPWQGFLITPAGLMLSVALTRYCAPYTGGSGIPQVMGALSLPAGTQKKRMVQLRETLLKIPLTLIAMFAGASVGREGPSIQIGASVMHAWGNWCRKKKLWLKNLSDNDLIAAGAAGGLAAAFNAPLAGVIFAVETLGKRANLRWDRHILMGVLAAGFFQVALMGNHPHFPYFKGSEFESMLPWVLLCGLAAGIGGGIFARLLCKGLAGISAARYRGFIRRHPVVMAGVLGLAVAALGFLSGGKTFGAGYGISEAGLTGAGTQESLLLFPAKFAATVFSAWTGAAGGIFMPSLTTGAALGMGLWQLAGTEAAMDVLVLLCMAAFLAASTQSPLTAGVVVMEMTGAQPMLLWLMAASLLASAVAQQINPQPFYSYSAGRYIQQVREEFNQREQQNGGQSESKKSE